MIPFDLIQVFGGYQNKHDITSLAERTRLSKNSPFIGILVAPSQNVLFGDDSLPGIRNGYSLYGQANPVTTPIVSSYDWKTSSGANRSLRFYNGVLELDFDGAGQWEKVNRDDEEDETFDTDAFLRFAEWWSDTEREDELLFVDGTSNLFEWTGATATFASCTDSTVTLQGSSSWGSRRFLTSGSRSIFVKDDAGTWHLFIYDGGEDTTTLTGLNDLTGFSISPGNPIIQAMRVNPFAGFSRPSQFQETDPMDLIAVFNNQVLLGYTQKRYVFLSKQNSLTDYTQSSPRIPGDGLTLTLDGAPVAFATSIDNTGNNQANAIYISAGQNFWYQVTFQRSSDLANESEVIKRLQSGPLQAAKSQELVLNLGTSIYFVAQDNTLLSLADLQQTDSIPLSDPIKSDFDGYDFTNASLKYFKPYLHVVLPDESKLHPFNITRKQWESPQILPAGTLAIINESLYMHSNAVPETYKLFDGTNDNGNPIDAKMYFAYHNYGDRTNYKIFNEFFTEGYISSNTTVTLVLKYEFGGFRSVQNFDIAGDDSAILFATTADNSLGKYPLGEQPIGSITDSIDDLAKFRHIKKVVPDNFFELQVGYEVNQIDGQFKMLAFGPNISLSDAQPVKIKK